MATIGNNDDKERAFVRDCFFDSKEERKLCDELKNNPVKNPSIDVIDMACKGDSKNYYDLACLYMNKVEAGFYPDDQMVQVEKIINYCLSKIEDIHPEQTQEPCIDDVDVSKIEYSKLSSEKGDRVIEDPCSEPICSDKEAYLRYEEECDDLTIV